MLDNQEDEGDRGEPSEYPPGAAIRLVVRPRGEVAAMVAAGVFAIVHGRCSPGDRTVRLSPRDSDGILTGALRSCNHG
jgi:hypothetical protein